MAAADTLRMCGGEADISSLEAVLHEQDIVAREAVYDALYEIGRRKGRAILKKG